MKIYTTAADYQSNLSESWQSAAAVGGFATSRRSRPESIFDGSSTVAGIPE